MLIWQKDLSGSVLQCTCNTIIVRATVAARRVYFVLIICVNLLVISVSYRHMSPRFDWCHWCLDTTADCLVFCCFFSTLFLHWWLFTSPRLRKSVRCGREASRRHVLRSYVLRWRRSIYGHRPGSFTRHQAGDSPHAGAAALAVVFSGNEPCHWRLVYIRRFRFRHQLRRPTVWLLRFWTCDHWITNLMMC